MTTFQTIVLCGVLLLSGGCCSFPYWYSQISPSPKDCIIYDTVHKDYYGVSSWTDRKQAKRMTWMVAHDTIRDYRIHERGEYADTGEAGYPLIVVQLEPDEL